METAAVCWRFKWKGGATAGAPTWEASRGGDTWAKTPPPTPHHHLRAQLKKSVGNSSNVDDDESECEKTGDFALFSRLKQVKRCFIHHHSIRSEGGEQEQGIKTPLLLCSAAYHSLAVLILQHFARSGVIFCPLRWDLSERRSDFPCHASGPSSRIPNLFLPFLLLRVCMSADLQRRGAVVDSDPSRTLVYDRLP